MLIYDKVTSIASLTITLKRGCEKMAKFWETYHTNLKTWESFSYQNFRDTLVFNELFMFPIKLFVQNLM